MLVIPQSRSRDNYSPEFASCAPQLFLSLYRTARWEAQSALAELGPGVYPAKKSKMLANFEESPL